MTNLEIAVARHEERLARLESQMCQIEKKLDKIYMWLIGVMGGMVVSLALLVINLGLGR